MSENLLFADAQFLQKKKQSKVGPRVQEVAKLYKQLNPCVCSTLFLKWRCSDTNKWIKNNYLPLYKRGSVQDVQPWKVVGQKLLSQTNWNLQQTRFLLAIECTYNLFYSQSNHRVAIIPTYCIGHCTSKLYKPCI